jgi:hypothetical protein
LFQKNEKMEFTFKRKYPPMASTGKYVSTARPLDDAILLSIVMVGADALQEANFSASPKKKGKSSGTPVSSPCKPIMKFAMDITGFNATGEQVIICLTEFFACAFSTFLE